MRARNASCRRLRRLVNASPVSRSRSPSMPERRRQGVPVVGRPAELELAGDVAGQATPAQVLPGRAGGGVGEQLLVVPLDGRVHGLDQALAPGPFPGLPGRRVRQRHADLGRQVLDRADEVDVLVLLHEREDVARLVAAEALVAPRLLAHVERRRPLGVERAQPDPVAPGLAQRDELADHVDDRHLRPQPLDVLVRDRHGCSLPGADRAVCAAASERRERAVTPACVAGVTQSPIVIDVEGLQRALELDVAVGGLLRPPRVRWPSARR